MVRILSDIVDIKNLTVFIIEKTPRKIMIIIASLLMRLIVGDQRIYLVYQIHMEKQENQIMPEIIVPESSTSWTREAIEIMSIPQESLQTFHSASEDSLRLQSNQRTQLADSQQTLSLGKKEQPLSLEKVRALFDEQELDDQSLVSKLKEIMDNAVTANPKTWELMEDYKTQLDAVKYIMKLKWFGWKDAQFVVNLFNSNQWKIW